MLLAIALPALGGKSPPKNKGTVALIVGDEHIPAYADLTGIKTLTKIGKVNPTVDYPCSQLLRRASRPAKLQNECAAVVSCSGDQSPVRCRFDVYKKGSAVMRRISDCRLESDPDYDPPIRTCSRDNIFDNLKDPPAAPAPDKEDLWSTELIEGGGVGPRRAAIAKYASARKNQGGRQGGHVVPGKNTFLISIGKGASKPLITCNELRWPARAKDESVSSGCQVSVTCDGRGDPSAPFTMNCRVPKSEKWRRRLTHCGSPLQLDSLPFCNDKFLPPANPEPEPTDALSEYYIVKMFVDTDYRSMGHLEIPPAGTHAVLSYLEEPTAFLDFLDFPPCDILPKHDFYRGKDTPGCQIAVNCVDCGEIFHYCRLTGNEWGRQTMDLCQLGPLEGPPFCLLELMGL